jgi:uncharacterized protein (TIGR00369 family)
MQTLPHTRSCFVCGESNPAGLKLRFETDGRVAFTRFTPREEHIGFQQTIHGGILGTVLDEIMVWACAVGTGRFAFCAELTVRFARPARPGEELLVTAELVENRRERIFEAKGEIKKAAGAVIASATGKYVPIKETETPAMLADLIGEWRPGAKP